MSCIKRIIIALMLVFSPCYMGLAHANDDGIITYDDLQNIPRDNTVCASGIFANALKQTASAVSETSDEEDIKVWIYATFSDKHVLEQVLKCSEITSKADDETIRFMPVVYKFPGGREIVVNYETQPKILKQRLLLANKRGTPSSDPNPRIGAGDAVWTNVDPAWYAIMVTEHGALDNFVGPDKNNTISLEYIAEHIDELYPSSDGAYCTDRSAVARDDTTINQVTKITVGMTDDPNDYYIAGDVNLQWITYLEIALDVVITVVTWGAGTAITGTVRAVQASRSLKTLFASARALQKLDTVKDYIRVSRELTEAQKALRTMDRAADGARYLQQTDRINDLQRSIRTLEQGDDVRRYIRTMDSINDSREILNALRGINKLRRVKNTGNVAVRTYKATTATLRAIKAAKAAKTAKKLNKAAKLARRSMSSGRVRDWLFHSTMNHAAALGRVASKAGIAYGAISVIGGMYDWTDTSTGDFTNNIEFSPLLLLSADEIPEQENVVNHGMWLLWYGSSTTPGDDDAAFLQSMDFASKLHEDLVDFQQSQGTHHCRVDIWVVRPIIRDPGTDHQALYYLIMNDIPWTTEM